MKINATKFYTSIFVIVVLLQLYVSSFRFNIFLQLFVLLSFIVIEKVKISIRFFKITAPIFFVFLIGFIGMLLNRYNLFNITKDIFHFIKPILAVFIGYCFYKKINNFRLFIKTIVLTGFLSAIVHYIIIIFVVGRINDVSNIREYGTDNFVELYALLFLLFYKKYKKEKLFISRTLHYIILLVLIPSNILYFSRTMIVITIMTLLTIYGFTIITKKSLKIAAFLLVFIIAFYSILFSSNIQRNSKGIESFLFKIKNAPEEVFKTHVDRDNHADLWDHWRGYEASRAFSLLNENPKTYLYGCGYGSLVNLKFFAPLSKDDKGMRFISELHNGYVYILYKTGIIGLLFYIYFLFLLYLKIYLNKNFTNIFISAIGTSFLFTTLVTVGINNANDTVIFLLGGLLFFNQNDTTIKSLKTEDEIIKF